MQKILFVDDEEPIRILYSEELAEEGYEVIPCEDVSKLMELIEQRQPDLVVMDIRLGEYDGLDLLQDIRNAHDELPVILCTAYPSFRHDLKAIVANDYVVKGSSLEELKSKIRRTLQSAGSLPSATEPTKSLPPGASRLYF